VSAGTVRAARAVRAPGKALLIGEYAVLDGAPAVVAAVDCFAEARMTRGEPTSPFIAAAIEESLRALHARGVAPAELPIGQVPLVDTSAFSEGGRKLGVGSSAAATVAAVGALFDAAGLDVTDAAVRAEVQAVATRAHDQAQGVRGSGADVLAATWGGVSTLNAPADRLLRGAAAPPVLIRFIPTTQSASTAQLVERYRSLHAEAAPARARLGEAARRFLDAWHGRDAGALLESVAAACAGYEALGQILGRALVTDDHARIVQAARAAGGAAKPSGAGGGDLAVAFFPDEAAVERCAALLPPSLRLSPLRISDRGLHPFTEASPSLNLSPSGR
jgi:mevalonate kinase